MVEWRRLGLSKRSMQSNTSARAWSRVRSMRPRIRLVFSDEKKLSIAALSHTLPDRLIEQVTPGSACCCEGDPRRRLLAKTSAAEAGVERLRRSFAGARPTPGRLMPNLGRAYRRTAARLREALTEGNNPEAVEAARGLINRVIIHPTPRGTPPKVSVEGHLAQMLTTAQPDLPPQAAKAIATAAESSMKEGPGGGAPRLC